MSEDQLSLLDEDGVLPVLWCRRHRYASQQSFIEVTVRKQKVMRCRYCEEVKLEKKKAAALDWYNHKKFTTDYYVRRVIARESKMKMEDIPQEIVEAKRATLQLKNLIVDVQKPLLVCRKHGKLYLEDVNRSEVTKTGFQRYKCRACQKDQHARHYQANKALLLLKQNQYRKEKPELVRAQRQRYRKTESYRTFRALQEKAWVRNLANHYIKKIVAKKKGLKYSEVPNERVEIERAVRILKREIKLKSAGVDTNEKPK